MGNIQCYSIDAIIGGKSLSTYITYAKIIIHCYSSDETINKISIGCMINPSLKCNKLFVEQVEKCLFV